MLHPNPSRSLGRVYTPILNNSRNTYAMPMKFCPSEQYLLSNIMKSKLFPYLTSKHEQTLFKDNLQTRILKKKITTNQTISRVLEVVLK